MDVKRLFGENLRKFRKEKGLSQEQLAEKTGVSAKHIGALETGISFVSSDLLEKFAELFDIPVSNFFMERTEILPNDYSSLMKELDLIISQKMTQATNIIINETRRAIFSK
ncbi:MAG: helix-turn-helix transcriptional regulator [Treponema sp.]|nr:helix-turn-helix transcriptional regulator [Candidatus Treponema equifaecale]